MDRLLAKPFADYLSNMVRCLLIEYWNNSTINMPSDMARSYKKIICYYEVLLILASAPWKVVITLRVFLKWRKEVIETFTKQKNIVFVQNTSRKELYSSILDNKERQKVIFCLKTGMGLQRKFWECHWSDSQTTLACSDMLHIRIVTIRFYAKN